MDSNSHQGRTSCAFYRKMGMLTQTSCSYKDRHVISHFAAAANLPYITGSPAPGQGPKFLRSAYPHLGAAVAPVQGLCPWVKSCAAYRFCFVVSVLVAFLHSSAIAWRTSYWIVGVVVAWPGGSGRLELGTDDVRSQLACIVDRSLG